MGGSILDQVLQHAPEVRAGEPVRAALRTLLDTELPALPVVEDDGRYAGVFGEREFMTALFPGYLNELSSAAFLTEDIDEALEKRSLCAAEAVRDHMTTEHVDVPCDASDAQIAEVFLHHRVLIVPVTQDGRVRGVVRRSAFFKALAERLLQAAP